MHLQCQGAAHTVTGSMHVLTVGGFPPETMKGIFPVPGDEVPLV
jgi:hypothetical protein